MRESQDFSAHWLWDLDPVFLDLGGVEIRYYGLCFFAMFVTGYTLWRLQMLRGGHAVETVARIIPYGVLGVVVGGRIIHCLFYEPEFYLVYPLEMLNLQRSGLASHGSVLGLFIGLWLYSRRFGYSPFEIVDRFAYALMPAGAFVRLGNFLNSGIVGAESQRAWAVRFQRFAEANQLEWEKLHGPLGWLVQPLPRHPVQLYEGAGMLAIFGVIWWVDRRLGEGRPRGLIVGLVLTLYFAFRWSIESLKEVQRFASLEPDPVARVIHVVPTAEITMGQWLSVLPFLIGVGVLVYALRTRLPAARPVANEGRGQAT